MRGFLAESWLVLALGAGCAALLAATQSGLAPRIDANRRSALEAAVAGVVPGTTGFEELRAGGTLVYRCHDGDGRHVGWAVPATGFGFQDRIGLVIGLSADGQTLTGVDVVESTETPGLGSRIEDEEWRRQYAGRDAGRPLVLVKRSPSLGAQEVEAVTGATISSEAVTRIVNEALADVRPRLDALRSRREASR